MKNRIYKIKDKILVQGNENKLTENEILVKEENGYVVLKERVNGEVKSIAGGSEFYLNLPILESSKVYEVPVPAVCTDYNLNTKTFKFEVDLTGQNVNVSDYDVFVIKQFTTEDSNLSGKFDGYSLVLDNTEDTSYTEDVLGYTSREVSSDVASVTGSDILKGAVTSGDLEVKNGLIIKIFGVGFLA